MVTSFKDIRFHHQIIIDQKNVSIDISKKSTFNLLIEDIFKLKSFETIFFNNENFQNEICFLVFINFPILHLDDKQQQQLQKKYRSTHIV